MSKYLKPYDGYTLHVARHFRAWARGSMVLADSSCPVKTDTVKINVFGIEVPTETNLSQDEFLGLPGKELKFKTYQDVVIVQGWTGMA